MPDIDGFDTCERLRRLTGGEHVPVLMLTGLDDESSIARAYEAGATDFFVKTTSQWTLLSERLRYMIRASRMREELADSRSKLTQGTTHRATRKLGMEHRRALGEALGRMFSDRRPAAAGRGLADWFVWAAGGRRRTCANRMLFREALAGTEAMNFECRIAAAEQTDETRARRSGGRSRRGRPRRRDARRRTGHHRAQACRRPNPPARQLRQSDRTAEPALLSRPVRLRARARAHQRHRGRRAVHRSRPLQADQRHARPPGRRSTAARGCQAALSMRTRKRHGGARAERAGPSQGVRPPSIGSATRSRLPALNRHQCLPTPTASRAWAATSSRFC